MRFYSGGSLEEYFEGIRRSIIEEINNQPDTYLLGVNTDDYIAHLYQKFRLSVPEIKFEEVFVDAVERDIPASRFPRFEFGMEDSDTKSYRKEVMIYHLPYSGNIGLLAYRPNPWTMMTVDVAEEPRQRCFLIEVVNFYNDPEKIKRQYEEKLRNIQSNYGGIVRDCNKFNENLSSYFKYTIDARKTQIEKKNNLVSALGVPLRKKENISHTFSVPSPSLRDKIIVKPVVLDKKFTPEPMLDEENYIKILKLINDIGKNFERMPSSYKGKSEEDIRDHILFVLDPNFEYGSAGGETFNKKGRTDISLRYDSSVVFVAECKYWKGESGFLKTIDQLLGYLTWRNSKVAIINFVQNNEFTDVLHKIETSSKKHENYLKDLGKKDETWFNYKFHLNDDRNRELDLAIISFHLPK
ncbi:hypothetical protein ACSBL2_23495 [Pedobacter sp. AW31-3R]|uniref:hypothetical protein n=1 Tax=Pedobacter sp. AW31-3R TaxID=3445781 RepID=UPI003FA15443